MAGQQDVGALVVTLEAQTAAFEKGMQQATNELKKFGNTSKTVESQFGGVSGAFFKFNQTLMAVQGGMAIVQQAFGSITGFAKAREAILSLEGSFKAVLGSGERAADMIGRVYKVSSELGLPINQTADAMRRLSIGLKQLGSSNEEIQTVTENFLKLGATGGSIEEAAGAIFQFSQALGSGALRGDEMISLLERAPTIANRIAESLGVTIGQLRKMGGEGKVTSEILRDALLDADGKIAAAYSSLPRRMSQNLNAIANEFNKFKIKVAETFQLNENINAGLEKTAIVAKYVFANMTAFAVDFSESLGEIKKVAMLTAIVFAGPLLEGIVLATRAMYAFAAANPFTALVAIAGVVILNWTTVKKLFIDIGIAAIDAGIYVKEAFGLDTSGLEVLKSDLLLIKLRMDDVGNSAAATGKGFDQNTEALKNNAKAGRDVWKSFTEGIQNFKEDLGFVTKKIEYLINLLKTEQDPRMISHLREEIDKLKAIGDPFEQWRQSLEAANNDTLPALTEKVAYLQMLILDTKDPVLLKKYKEDLENLEATIGRSTNKFYDLEQKINGAATAAKDLAEGFAIIDKALAEGKISPQKAEELKAGLEGVNLELKKMSEGITDALDRNASNAVNNFIDTMGQAKFSFSQFTESILKDIAKMIVQLMIMKPLMAGIQSMLPGASVPGTKSMPTTDSDADVYDSPTLFKFAKGGIFAGGYQQKLGMLGEAGPEAIMPLSRGANGKLGVSASAGPTTVNVYNNAGTEVKTSETTNSDGSKPIDILIEKKVKDLFGSGSMDKSMRASYGLVRSAA